MGASFTLTYSNNTLKKSIYSSTDGKYSLLSTDTSKVILSNDYGITWTDITPNNWSQIYPNNLYSPSKDYSTNGQPFNIGGSVAVSGNGKYIATFANGLLVYSKTSKIV